MNILDKLKEGEKLETFNEIAIQQTSSQEERKKTIESYFDSSEQAINEIEDEINDKEIFEILDMTHNRLNAIFDGNKTHPLIRETTMNDPKKISTSDIKTFN